MNPIYAQIAKKLPSPIYKLLAQFYMDQNFPRHLFIETTATCNLSCSYCPREKIRQDMDFELFRKIINEASKYGTRSFSLHLFGEPLLYPRILDAIRYIKETNKRHVVLVTTNGTKINEFAEELIALKIDQVFWTWRTEATFNESTLETLRKWGRFRVRFIKEITPEDQYKKWSKWPNLETRSLHNYGGDIETWKFGETRSRAQPSKWEFRWPCYHLWFAPAISWNGNILICCSDPHQKEVIGKFPQMSIHNAWTSEKFKSIRDSHLKGKYAGICAKCDVWKEYPDVFFKWQKTKSA